MSESIHLNVLNRMCKEFEEAETPAAVKHKGDEGYPTDVLVSVMDDYGTELDRALCEFYFVAIDNDDEMEMFSCNITFSEDVDIKYMSDLYQAIVTINMTLPAGAFMADASTGYLGYRLVTPVSTSLTEEELFEQMSMNMGVAMPVAEQFCGVLMQITRGEATIQDVFELLQG